MVILAARQVCCILCFYFGFVCAPEKFNFILTPLGVTIVGPGRIRAS